MFNEKEFTDFYNNNELLRKKAYHKFKPLYVANLEEDEAHQMINMAFMNAYKHYIKNSKGYEFSTFFYKWCQSLFNRRIRFLNAKKRVNYEGDLSLSAYLYGGEDGDKKLSMLDKIEAPDIEANISEEELILKQFLNLLKDDMRETVYLSYKGYTQLEIANMMDVRQSAISRRLKKANKIFKEVFIDEV